MKKMKFKIPDSIDELEILFSKSSALDSRYFYKCKCCGARDYYDNMRGVQYREKLNGSVIVQIFFCRKCVDIETYDFILSNNIDIRSFCGRQIKNIMSAFYSGEYDIWLQEKS